MLNYTIESLKAIQGVTEVKVENEILEVTTIYKRKNRGKIRQILNAYFINSSYWGENGINTYDIKTI